MSVQMLVCLLVAVVIGCGGGNKLFRQRGGKIVTGTLVLDSIPVVPKQDEYVIGYGDELNVVFLYHREHSIANLVVRPDGKISFPLVGEITVLGMKPSEIEDIITESFSEIIVDPEVTVIISKYQSKLVYVLGKVGSPGGYAPELVPTLLAALTSARGLSEGAKRSAVLVMRRVAPDHVVGIQVDVGELLDDHRFELDIPLMPNDIVYVSESVVNKTVDFVNTLNTIIGTPMNLYLRGWQAWNIKTYYEYWRRQASASLQ